MINSVAHILKLLVLLQAAISIIAYPPRGDEISEFRQSHSPMLIDSHRPRTSLPDFNEIDVNQLLTSFPSDKEINDELMLTARRFLNHPKERISPCGSWVFQRGDLDNDPSTRSVLDAAMIEKLWLLWSTIPLSEENKNFPETNTCPICLEEFNHTSDIKTWRNCHHSFDASCMSKWQESSHTCPVCREEDLLTYMKLSAKGVRAKMYFDLASKISLIRKLETELTHEEIKFINLARHEWDQFEKDHPSIAKGLM